jgi:tryptophan synthase alpha chain
MNRYDSLKKHPSYMPYVLLGYPDMDRTVEICAVLASAGAHGLELGFPFRDPVADGPVIQAAAKESLDGGFNVPDAVGLVRRIRAAVGDLPLTAMVYYNMVLARGAEKFLKEFAEAGLDGLLIPDLPPERAHEIAPLAKKYNVALVFIAAPNTGAERLNLIKPHAGGFVYVVTRLGVTGFDANYSGRLPQLFKNIHAHIPLPAIAGFGISDSGHAADMIAAGADGVITGSKIVDLVRAGDMEALRAHTKGMVGALR